MRKKFVNVLMAAFALSIHLSGTGAAMQYRDPAEVPALTGLELVTELPADEENTDNDAICPMSDNGDTRSNINIGVAK